MRAVESGEPNEELGRELDREPNAEFDKKHSATLNVTQSSPCICLQLRSQSDRQIVCKPGLTGTFREECAPLCFPNVKEMDEAVWRN